MDRKVNSSFSPLWFTALWLLWQEISQIKKVAVKKREEGVKQKLAGNPLRKFRSFKTDPQIH